MAGDVMALLPTFDLVQIKKYRFEVARHITFCSFDRDIFGLFQETRTGD